MTQTNDRSAFVPGFLVHQKEVLRLHPPIGGTPTMTRCPGVLDVMGGIGEDSGSLVLTATLAMSFAASAWRINDADVRVRLLTEGGQGGAHDCSLPVELFSAEPEAPEVLVQRCRLANAEWALPSYLVMQQAIKESLLERPTKGLMLLLQSDFPADADFGRHCVQAAASLDAICKAQGIASDRVRQSRICAAAVARLTGQFAVRTALTSYCAPAGGGLLQLRFHPQVTCQPLELPPGVTVVGALTRLSRPTTQERLAETRTCTEMGTRMIMDLQRHDGVRVDDNGGLLSNITRREYVERFRDRMPSKIDGKSFVAKFGEVRGINGKLDPQEVYKVRSRAEHHIYENERVHEFVASLGRAKRNASIEDLTNAGGLMYASHWSHSQRCGIGGVEPDQFVNCVRAGGPEAGLFGAKVTAGGAGGELVVLMRDTAQARSVLREAIARAEAASNRKIHIWEGSLPGADHFQPPKLDEAA